MGPLVFFYSLRDCPTSPTFYLESKKGSAMTQVRPLSTPAWLHHGPNGPKGRPGQCETESEKERYTYAYVYVCGLPCKGRRVSHRSRRAPRVGSVGARLQF